MNKVVLVAVILVIVIIVIAISVKLSKPQTEDDYKALYTNSKYFLDQNNAHGAVVGTVSNPTWKTCIVACQGTDACGGVTYNSDTKTCYMSKPGNYWGASYASDNGWSKV